MSTFAGESFPFEDGSIGFDSRLPSQRLDEFSNFEAESVVDSTFSPEQNGKGFGEPDGPILSSPEEMEAEEGFPLREWRRQNAIELKEKEKREKEMLQEIIEDADQYIIDFYRRHKLTTDNNKASNRDKEKRYLENRKKFHAEAEKNYWKAIAELIPSEVPAIESRGKKDKEKKPSIVVIQGPKPGKPTDLVRMRQILLKLKHNNPSHMKPKPPPPPPSESKKDPKGESSATGSSSNGASTSSTTSKTVAVVTSEGVTAA